MSFFKRAYQFIRYDVWRSSAEFSKKKRMGYSAVKTILLTARGFSQDDIATRANALTYSMLFAIVPIIAMIVAVANGFGFAGTIENWLNSFQFLKEMNAVPVIMDFVTRYLETAQGGVFLGIGILILLWAIYAFFRNTELAFNDIWDVKKSRSILRQLTTYFSTLLMIPVLIVVSTGMSVYLSSALSSVIDTLPWLTECIIKLAPFVICWLIFSWLYWAVPNQKVTAKAAFIPGILIGTCYQLLQMLSVYLVLFLSRTSIVYGAFAAIPLLLTWLQIVCLLILIGAELSYAVQNNEYYDYDDDMQIMSRRYKDFLTVYLCRRIALGFEKGDKPLTATELARENNMPIRLVNNLLSRLVETDTLRETFVENRDDKGYIPAIDLQHLTVGRVLQHISAQGSELFLKDTPEHMQAFWDEWLTLTQAETDLSKRLIKDL